MWPKELNNVLDAPSFIRPISKSYPIPVQQFAFTLIVRVNYYLFKKANPRVSVLGGATVQPRKRWAQTHASAEIRDSRAGTQKKFNWCPVARVKLETSPSMGTS